MGGGERGWTVEANYSAAIFYVNPPKFRRFRAFVTWCAFWCAYGSVLGAFARYPEARGHTWPPACARGLAPARVDTVVLTLQLVAARQIIQTERTSIMFIHPHTLVELAALLSALAIIWLVVPVRATKVAIPHHYLFSLAYGLVFTRR